MYDHDWNLNETVTKSFINKRCILGNDLDVAARSSSRGTNNPNFRDKQDKSLKGYKQRHLENIRQFLQFMINDKKSSISSSPITPKKYSKRFRIATSRLIDNQLNETNSRVKVRYIPRVICRNESSLSVMTNEANRNISTVGHFSKLLVKKGKDMF